MLYFLYGTDTHKARKKLHELLDLAQKKRPGAEIFKINTENWSEGQFEELLVSRGLFEQKYTVVLDNLFEKKEIKNYILEKLEELKVSEQIFLSLEASVLAGDLKKIEKSAEKIQEFKKEPKKSDFNIFSVADGILRKDKKRLWVSFLDVLSRGAEPEEVHGIFFWQIKNMILASRAKDSSETGLSPFVYKNALTGARKYITEELLKMSSQLVDMTHRVRNGEGELGIMLEKWILSI